MWDVMAGGIDTTATTLEWLFYIMCNYPESQANTVTFHNTHLTVQR